MSDGSQMPVHSQLISISGPGYGGRNAAVIGSSTVWALPSVARLEEGQGAAIGAGAGAAVGILGALAAKGYPTIVTPEAVLTFRVDQPIVVATDHAPQAFRYAGPGDYNQPRFASQLEWAGLLRRITAPVTSVDIPTIRTMVTDIPTIPTMDRASESVLDSAAAGANRL